MKAYFLVLAIAIVAMSTPHPGLAQNDSQLLEEAYCKNNKEKLEQFFQNWHQNVKPITKKELANMNDTIRQIYAVFFDFYRPEKINNIFGYDLINGIYKYNNHPIIQNSIKIYFIDKINYTEKEKLKYLKNNNIIESKVSKNKYISYKNHGKIDKWFWETYGPKSNDRYIGCRTPDIELINFRPRIRSRDETPVYLNSNYETLLNYFLVEDHLPVNLGGILSTDREIFLNSNIFIWDQFWRTKGDWTISFYPYVNGITFDEQMKYAIVDFTLIDQGAEVFLKNDHGHWKIIAARKTWVA